MSLLLTAVVSAGVAGVVTLGVEYAAKPRLDARKERIVERFRRQREAAAAVDRGSLYIGRLLTYQDEDEIIPGRIATLAKQALPIYENDAMVLDISDEEISNHVISAAARVYVSCLTLAENKALTDDDWKALDSASDIVSTGAEYAVSGRWKRRQFDKKLRASMKTEN